LSPLAQQWREVCAPVDDLGEKGKRLERFVRRLFAPLFTVVEERKRTAIGEVDLIFEVHASGPFWFQYGSDVFVECKNHGEPVSLHDVDAFHAKVTKTRVRLAFLVSASGFTRDALGAFRDHALQDRNQLLVPVTGSQITEMLEVNEELETFLKQRVRAMSYVS
jgi:hypothetical protein